MKVRRTLTIGLCFILAGGCLATARMHPPAPHHRLLRPLLRLRKLDSLFTRRTNKIPSNKLAMKALAMD